MEPIDNIEEIIRNKLNATPASALHDHILAQVRQAQAQDDKTKSARNEPVLRRPIMKNPISKLAIAAAIIAAVVLGLFEFTSTDGGSGVVWAEVAQKVQASPGVIYRSRSNRSDPKYSMHYLSPTQNREDVYENGGITISNFVDLEAMTGSSLIHMHKGYWRDVPLHEQNAHQHNQMTDPKWIVQSILSCEHTKLGRKTIEGVLCEGLETTDPAVLGGDLPVPADQIELHMQLWVSVETNYPVLCEANAAATIAGEAHSSEWVLDEYQWDVELDPSLFELNIPADYIEM